MEYPVTVAIIEDHPVVTEGVASWIRSDPGQRVRLVQTASDLAGLRAALPPSADVVILDLELSGEMVIAQIPDLVAAGYRVVAFSGHSDPAIVMETLDSGAHAYVSKEEGREHLVEAVLATAADRPYVTRSQARAILADQHPARPALSEQEQQALLLWFQGMSKASVGRRMSISENTVRQYISRARAKYAATGRTAPSKDALLARAIEDGVIKPAEIVPYRSFARGAPDLPGLGGPGRLMAREPKSPPRELPARRICHRSVPGCMPVAAASSSRGLAHSQHCRTRAHCHDARSGDTTAVGRKAALDARAGLGDAAGVASQATACFRPCSGETWRSPWAMYAALRDADPVHYVEDGDYWVLSRYSDVQAAVLDSVRYCSAQGLTISYDELTAAGLREIAPLVMLDPPEHTEFRALIGRGYTPRRVAGIESRVREYVRARLEVVADLGECDIVAELFRPVPSFVVAGYLGVPDQDRARFDGWTRGIVEAVGSGASHAAGTSAELFGYFAALIERRRAEPADDTISDLVHLIDGDPAGTLRILGFAFTMITGGNDTATGLLSGAAELLTSHSDQRQLLLDRPDLMPAAIEEMLRLTSPVQCLARTLTTQTTVHGRTLPAGRKVLLLYGSANRDPRAFGPDAEEFGIQRDLENRHLAFALGPHHCLGAAAARLQARVVLHELLDRFPGFAVDAAAGTFAPGHYTRRYATLPFTTAA
jgi:cytochrome P450 family 130